MSRVYDSMIRRDPYTLLWRPWIAYDWKEELWDNAGTLCNKITYYLHENVVWSDGVPLTSADVAFSLYDVKTTLAARGLPAPWWISNVANIFEVTTPDDYTVVVKFDIRSYAAAGLAGGTVILPKHKWYDLVNLYDPTTFSPEPTLTGTGPFIFAEYVPGSYITMYANPLTWTWADKSLYVPHPTAAGTGMQSYVGITNRASTTASLTVTLEYESSPGTWTLVGSKTTSIPGNARKGVSFEAELATAGLLGDSNVKLRARVNAPVRGVTVEAINSADVTRPGDIDTDFYIGLKDAGYLVKAYRGVSERSFLKEDINLDGSVGLADATILSTHYGKYAP